jgi:hypothetical protein
VCFGVQTVAYLLAMGLDIKPIEQGYNKSESCILRNHVFGAEIIV